MEMVLEDRGPGLAEKLGGMAYTAGHEYHVFRIVLCLALSIVSSCVANYSTLEDIINLP